jgi:integrase
MSKKTGTPWYRKGTDSWYVWHENRQIRLARGRANKAEAHARFADLLGAPPADRSRPVLALAATVEAYRAYCRPRVKASTFKSYECILAPFVAAFGTRAALVLTTDEVEQWARKPKWSQTTQRYALTVVAAVYKWAARAKAIDSNPLAALNRPAGRSRGSDILIDEALHERILSVASPQFADFLTVVRATGARPGEVARVEARHIVWESACWILTEHKTASRGRVRIVFMPPSVVALVRRLAEQALEGPIFRNTRGEPWVKTGWKQAMERAQRKLGLAHRPLTSGYRHTFATDALERGVPDTHVAELLGHSSTAMVAKHYGHLAAKARVLRQSLSRFRGEVSDPANEERKDP